MTLRHQLDQLRRDLRSLPPACPGCAHRRGKRFPVRDELPPACERCGAIPETMLFDFNFAMLGVHSHTAIMHGAWNEGDRHQARLSLVLTRRLREKAATKASPSGLSGA
jgi:hypothetical protein